MFKIAIIAVLRKIFADFLGVFMSNHELKALPNQVLAYTDGACRGNGSDTAVGGFGAVLVLPTGEQVELFGGEQATTNNRMELMGAIVALEHSPNDLPIQLWTDSGYVQKGITQWITGWKNRNWRKSDGKPVQNQELWQRLDTACQNRQIDWQWVKGHAGHIGNEYADKLANQGIENLPKQFEKIVKNPIQNTLQNQQESPMFSELPDKVYEQMFEQQTFDDVDNTPDTSDIFLAQLDDENTSGFVENSKQKTKKNHPISTTLSENFAPFLNEENQFIAQHDELIAMRPAFDGNTKAQNQSFIPLLPIAKNRGVSNRQLILDTETTGLEAQNGDRIIEIGVVELVNRRFTGEKLHVYINPLREVGEDSIKVHGIHNEFLAQMPTFEQVAQVVYDFLYGAEIVAHNATFDMSFLQAEFARFGLADFEQNVCVTDSLAIAKQMYVGQRNNLDALVKRLNVGKQDRTFHGALLDAEILAEVYLAMTGGQVSLDIDDQKIGFDGYEHQRFDVAVGRFFAKESDEKAHLDWLNALKNKHEKVAKNWGISFDSASDMTV